MGDAGGRAGGEIGLARVAFLEPGRGDDAPQQAEQDRLVDEIDDEAVPAGEGERAARPALSAATPSSASRRSGAAAAPAPSPMRTTPDQGISGRQSSVCGAGSEPEPDQRRRVERRAGNDERRGDGSARADRNAAPGGAATNSAANQAGDDDAMEDAEIDRLRGAKP